MRGEVVMCWQVDEPEELRYERVEAPGPPAWADVRSLQDLDERRELPAKALA